MTSDSVSGHKPESPDKGGVSINSKICSYSQPLHLSQKKNEERQGLSNFMVFQVPNCKSKLATKFHLLFFLCLLLRFLLSKLICFPSIKMVTVQWHNRPIIASNLCLFSPCSRWQTHFYITSEPRINGAVGNRTLFWKFGNRCTYLCSNIYTYIYIYIYIP